MAKGINNVILEGRLTKDPLFSKGSMRFTLAVNRGNKTDGTDAGTDFIPCVAFGKTAEYLNADAQAGYLKKGTHFAILSASLQSGSYDKDGEKIYTLDVNVQRYQLILDVQRDTQTPPQQQAPQQGFPPQQAPQQGFPPQQVPQQGFPPQQMPPQQGNPQQQTPQQSAPQPDIAGMTARLPWN